MVELVLSIVRLISVIYMDLSFNKDAFIVGTIFDGDFLCLVQMFI